MTKPSTRAARACIAAGAIAAAIAAMPAAAQTLTTGGAEVRAFLATSGSNVLAAAYGGGLYSSTNTGTSWTRVANLPGNVRYLTSIAGNAAGLTLVGADEGLVRSTAGASGPFTQVLNEPVAAVALASDNTTVLAGIKGLGIVRSVDGGATWAPANNAGFDSLDITAVAFHPTNASIAYAASKPDGTGARGGVFKSTDGGATWAADTGLPNNFVTSLTVDTSGEVYAGTMNGGSGDLYRQASGGGAWSGTADATTTVSVHRDANNGTTIWQGTRVLGLRSTTAATVGTGSPFAYAFSQSGTPNLLYTSVNAVATFPGNTAPMLMAVKGAGVWQSTTAASPRTWTRVNFPGADRVLSAAGASSTIYMGLYAGGVWKGTSSPINTSPVVNSGQADFSFAASATAVQPFDSIWDIAASSTSNVYVAAGGVGMFYGNDNGGVFRFNGTVWQGINGSTTGAPYNIVAESGYSMQQYYAVSIVGSTTYAGGIAGNVLTRSSGSTWSAVPGLSAGLNPYIRYFVAGSSGTPLVNVPFDDKPLTSTNGTTWSTVSVSQAGFERIQFLQVAQGSSSNIWVAGTQKGVFYSADTGVSWTRASMGGVFADLAVNAVGFRPGTNTAFAADYDGNRYCSSTNGVTWKSAGSQLPAGVNAMRVVNGTLYYLTDGAGMIAETGTCP